MAFELGLTMVGKLVVNRRGTGRFWRTAFFQPSAGMFSVASLAFNADRFKPLLGEETYYFRPLVTVHSLRREVLMVIFLRGGLSSAFALGNPFESVLEQNCAA